MVSNFAIFYPAQSGTAGRWWRQNLKPRNPGCRGYPFPASPHGLSGEEWSQIQRLRKNSSHWNLWERCIQFISEERPW